MAGETRFGYRNFIELASVFLGTESVSFRSGGVEIGLLDRWFVDDMRARDRSSFLLNGRAWTVEAWPTFDTDLDVVPGTIAEAPLFLGSGLVLGCTVTQRMKDVLSPDVASLDLLLSGVDITPTVARVVQAAREACAELHLDRPGIALRSSGPHSELYTYAGVRANRLIADGAFEAYGLATTVPNATIKVRSEVLDINQLALRLTALSRLEPRDALRSRTMSSLHEVKFIELLDDFSRQAFLSERLYDVKCARSITANGVRLVKPAG